MHKLTEADRIWNRACGDDPLRALPGDRALADLLRAHGLTMNGGVLQAIECMTSKELSEAEAGYRYYGLGDVAALLSRSRAIFEKGENLESHEQQLDDEYTHLIPSDSSLAKQFEMRLMSHPADFAPLRPKDRD